MIRLLNLAVRIREGFTNREHGKFEISPRSTKPHIFSQRRLSTDMNKISDAIFNLSRTFL